MEHLRNEQDSILTNLQSFHSDLKSVLKASSAMETNYQKMDQNFEAIRENLDTASQRVAPLQSMSIANKALETRINRAISPGLALLESFKLYEALQARLLGIASELVGEKKTGRRLKKLIKYVDCVNKLNESVVSISHESDPVIQKLQEVVEFLSRTKATDRYRTERLTETLMTLKAVCESEIDSMRFDGVLDEALLNLQDEFEGLLMKLKHENIDDVVADEDDDDESKVAVADVHCLGSDLEIEVLRKISETLAANDCLDICIDIFVKVRYRRAAKALMRLSPDYLKTYTPEEIDEMEWEVLETAIALWIQHFELALKTVFVSEKNLCNKTLGNILQGVIWPECFIKIADKIMAVFFRFGEGVARSAKEPQKLFKLLDMFDSLKKLKPKFSEIFAGEPGTDICTRFRELEKLLVHASTRVFYEFGLQIEGSQDGLPPPQDGSVPNLVRYAVNYLKNLTVVSYSAPMAQVLKTEQLWKNGVLSAHEHDHDLLKDAVSNVMDAIQRNVEFKKSRYGDKVLAQIFAMNSYWYIYMRSRNAELGRLLGEEYMKKKFRYAAEEAAYMYQKQAWGSLVRFLERGSMNAKEVVTVRGKMEGFVAGLDRMCAVHRSSYRIVSDAGLRDQMMDAAVKAVVAAYEEFYGAYYSSVLVEVRNCPTPELVRIEVERAFDGGDRRRLRGEYGRTGDSVDSSDV